MSERYYKNIKEVHEETDPEAVNELLKAGWELLTIKERTVTSVAGEAVTAESKVVYVLGRTTPAPTPTAPDMSIIPWKEGPYGDWAFTLPSKYTQMVLTEEQKRAIDWLRVKIEAEGSYEDARYKYTIGKNRDFMSRKPKVRFD